MQWYRLTFQQACWTFDTRFSESSKITNSLSQDLVLSGLGILINEDKGLLEIIRNMIKNETIAVLNLIAESEILGPNTRRLEVLFPSSVFIPTCHVLTPGLRDFNLSNKIVTIKDCKFISNAKFTVGISTFPKESVQLLRSANPSAFIGCMDDDPFCVASSAPLPKPNIAAKPDK
ncbi:TPA_asm: M [Garlic alphacytorhabdovirus 1]|nr:TPA_asm: M [Garlic alphacytorhabdovirus 1]